MMISYIIPCYNGAGTIEKCIQHILNQRGEFDREIIIVDDGSLDNSVSIVLKYPVTLYQRPHLGASATRNYGITKATGDFIVLIDADSFLDLPWTQQCLLEEPSSYDILITTDSKYHEEDPRYRAAREKIERNPYVTYDNLLGYIGNGTFLPARNRDLIKYDEMYYVGGEDVDLLCTLIEKGIKLKVALGPSFLHRHPKRAGADRYLNFAKKKILFAYGNIRTWLKHPQSEYARRDAMNNLWVLPIYPILWIYKKFKFY